MKITGFIAWVMWLFIHVLFLIGFRSKISILVNWAWCFITDTPGVSKKSTNPATPTETKFKPEIITLPNPYSTLNERLLSKSST